MSADARRLLALTGSAALLAAAVTVATPTARAAADSLPFTNCGGDSPARVSAIDVSPSPLRAGRDASVTVRGTLRQRVTGGSYDLRVSYLGAPLLHRTGDLSDVVRLPIPAGGFSLHKRVPVPEQAPSGRYNLTLTAADSRDDQLLCVRVPFRVR
jgi:ML domain